MPTQREKADRLCALHRPGDPLVLINVWDALTARIVEDLGYPAIATTSAGVAFAYGYPDGEKISRDEMLETIRRIARTVNVPVTADLEGAYGPTADDAAATARAAIDAGAVGLNFEDSLAGGTLVDADLQAARVAAMRKAANEAGIPLAINARTDAFLFDLGDNDEWRFEESVRRGKLYANAGATSIFVPGVDDERTIERLVKAIGIPLNILANASTPDVKRLAELGVARISTGSTSTGHAMAKFRSMADEVKKTGSFAFAAERIPHSEMNALFPMSP